MDVLVSLGEKYQINLEKPYFPVNTMRLFYLLLAHGQTDGNQEACDRVNQIIPKVSGILDARDAAMANKEDESSVLTQLEACKPAIELLLNEVDSSEIRQTLNVLFVDVYPMQETLLISIDSYLKQESLSLENLYSALRIRSMDSILYASVLAEIINEYSPAEGDSTLQINPMYWQISTTLQLNDLADAIVYAKQDLASKSATIVELIKRTLTPESGVTATVRQALKHYQDQSLQAPLKKGQELINDFNAKLIQMIG